MPPPYKPTEQSVAPPSNNLWIGNMGPEVTEADLQAIFHKYGQIDSITSYASRSYAFVYFKNLNDAKAAKDALQGHFLRGNPIRIEFAKPAKPCKSLWVAGISQSVSKEELEEEFKKFGKIQEFKFLRDRNTAYVDYFRLEDAYQALRSMNGKQIGGDQIRVDFLRSQPARREQWTDNRDAREAQFSGRGLGIPDARWTPPDVMRNYPEPVHAGSRNLIQPPTGQKGDGQPSKILWISYPPSVHVDEDMLHNAMILFGEIERIKTFADKNHSFVEFRSVDEAKLAKEGLQGKLFNDPRIMIEYSGSRLLSGKDVGYNPGFKGPGQDVYFDEVPFQAGQMEMLGPNRSMLPDNVPPQLPARGVHRRDMMMRPLGPQGSFEPGIPASKLGDLSAFPKLPETSPQNLQGGSNWRKTSPAPGVHHSSSAGSRAPNKSSSSGWDVFDASQIQREAKRSRVDGDVPGYGASFPIKRMDERGSGLDEHYGFGPLGNGSASGSLAKGKLSTGAPGQRHPEDQIWRGIIAKGGTPVCHARCVPLREEGIEFDIPEVVNCSARTGLDMLTKHYADAVGFNIIFFLPDSEDDFASYTEFLRYLGSKNRAGVAKCDDGTTLFLVPPSDFLTNVLNVVGPERLYGVVLKFRPHGDNDATSMQPHSLLPHNVNAQQISSSQSKYNIMPQERVLETDYTRVPDKDAKPPSRMPGPPANISLPMHSVPPVSSATMPQTGVSLTPELIATLASLLPANSKLSAPENVPLPSGSLTMAPGLVPNNGLGQGWKHEHHTREQTGHEVQPLSNQYNSQVQHVMQGPTYPVDSNTVSYSVQGLAGSSQIQDGNFNLHPQGPALSTPLPSAMVAYPHQVDQQYQHVMLKDTMKVQGVEHGTDALLYGSSSLQQSKNSVTLSSQVHGVHVPQQQNAMPLAPEIALMNQVHQLQSGQTSLHAGNLSSDVEADKNERYRSTLLFAANLLSKIQQEQPGAQAGQGSGATDRIP